MCIIINWSDTKTPLCKFINAMIEVFKTNVEEIEQSNMIVGKLLEHFPNSIINFDLEDCDKILRIHSSSISNNKIIDLLNSHGFHCEVLL